MFFITSAVLISFGCNLLESGDDDISLIEAAVLAVAAANSGDDDPEPPSSLTFPRDSYGFEVSTTIGPIEPEVSGTVTSCNSSPDLPAGLSLNQSNCALSGTPSSTNANTAYTITAMNSGGSTTDTLNIQIGGAGSDDDGDYYLETAGDCDDGLAFTNPGAAENCSDSLDNDCDGYVDAADSECP